MGLLYQASGLVLSRGGRATRAQVKELQRDLRRLGYLRTGIDGDYGKITENAVKALQFDLIKNAGTGPDGVAPVRDVRTQLALPVEESSDYHTVAGFLIHTLGAIPKPGASVAVEGYRWTVVDMDGPKITKVKVEREPR